MIKRGTILAEYGGEVLSYGHVWDQTACYFPSNGKVSAEDHEYQIDLKYSRRWAGTGEDREKRVLCVDGRVYGNEVVERTGHISFIVAAHDQRLP